MVVVLVPAVGVTVTVDVVPGRVLVLTTVEVEAARVDVIVVVLSTDFVTVTVDCVPVTMEVLETVLYEVVVAAAPLRVDVEVVSTTLV